MIECPDLQSAPFHLACKGNAKSFLQKTITSTLLYFTINIGLNGSPTIVEIGGPPFLLPVVDRTKLYDLREISKKVLTSSKEIFSIGAGAGYHPFLNQNCEVSM